MKRILFMTESYEPNPSPNAVCAKSVLDTLNRRGDDTSVITLRNALGQPSSEEIDGTKVWRLFEGALNGASMRLQRKQGAFAALSRKLVGALSHLKGAVMGFFYPLLSPWEVLRYYRKAKRLHKEQPFDDMVCVYHKISAVLAGVMMKRKFPELRFVVYTLDAVSGGWVPDILHSRTIPMRSLKRWERVMFGAADAVFVMESHRSHYQPEEYDYCRGKLRFLDIPLLAPREAGEREGGSDGKVHMVYTGSMSCSTANPRYLLKLLENPELGQSAVFDIYGNIAPDIMEEIKASRIYQNGGVVCHGRAPHAEILRVQEQADVLLNFGNANPCMIPCKIFEYMSTGKRIVSFTYSQEDSSLPYMRRYPNALILQEDGQKSNENRDQLLGFLQTKGCIISAEGLCRTFRANTPEYFVEQLEQLSVR